jgi:hypothetical protein
MMTTMTMTPTIPIPPRLFMSVSELPADCRRERDA